MLHLHRSKPRGRKLGWIPDQPDIRDFPYSYVRKKLIKLPPVVDLRDGCSPVEDQGELGSCTAQALVGALEYLDILNGDGYVDWSRLFVYYNERLLQGWENEDSGAYLRDGIKTLAAQGVCSEKSFPYNVKKFDRKPCASQYREALDHRIKSYYRITTLDDMLNVLAAKRPFVFGFTVYESFMGDEVARTGEGKLPQNGERVVGGHAVLAIGYNRVHERFLCKNSWGGGWGKDGYFTLPFEYMSSTSLSDDFWTIKLADV